VDTYVFYLCKSGGISISLEVHALISDDVASDWAQKVLAQHPTADFVSVTRDDIMISTHRRDLSRSVAASAFGASLG
jgi:hypothetical protein